MRSFIHIVKYTVVDIIHQKSFVVLLIVSIGFVMLLRSCYSGNYVVNGKAVDGFTVAWHASIVAFHVVAAGVLLIAAVLSMNLFRRDREDGTAQYMLSKPLSRITYVSGRAVGVWLVSFAFMFALHLTIFIITLVSAGGAMPGYLTASCVCSVNVLFMVLLVCLMSLYMPDFAAALAASGRGADKLCGRLLFPCRADRLVQAHDAEPSADVPPMGNGVAQGVLSAGLRGCLDKRQSLSADRARPPGSRDGALRLRCRGGAGTGVPAQGDLICKHSSGEQ